MEDRVQEDQQVSVWERDEELSSDCCSSNISVKILNFHTDIIYSSQVKIMLEMMWKTEHQVITIIQFLSCFRQGYPDPDYLDRVEKELEALLQTEDN